MTKPRMRTEAHRRADAKMAAKRVTWNVAYNTESQPELAEKLEQMKANGNLRKLFDDWLISI